MRTDSESTCGDKACHPSKQAARRAANALRALPSFQGHVTTYACPYAPAAGTRWHTGHVARRALRDRKLGKRFRDARFAA